MFVAAGEETTSITWDVMFLFRMNSFKGVCVQCYVNFYLFITTVEQQKCLIVAGTNQSDHRNTVIMYRRSI